MSNPEDFVIDYILEYVILSKYTGPGGDVVIPESVTIIGENAFYGCTGLTSVTIPKGVTEIKNYAFKNCSNLKSIDIPESITTIGQDCFKGCTSITSITIPEGITKIYGGTFDGCRSLTDITIPESVTEIAYAAFQGCKSCACIINDIAYIDKWVICAKDTIQSAFIKEGTRGMADSAFWGCSRLTDITIPESITEIGMGVFECCKSLTDITIPENATKIRGKTFKDCTNLSSIILPDGITEIGFNAFENCSSLTRISIPENVKEIGSGAFEGCSKLSHISLPKTMKLKPDMFDEQLPPALSEHIEEYLSNMSDALAHKAIFEHNLWKDFSVELQADIFLERQGKSTLPVYANNTPDPNPLGTEILKRLTAKASSKICNSAAAFMILFKDRLDSSILREFYQQLKSIKAAKKALEKIDADIPLLSKLGSTDTIIQDLPTAEKHITEILLQENISSADLEKQLQNYYSKIELPTVHYKDGSAASPLVLQWLLTTHERIENGYEVAVVPAYKEPGVTAQAAEIVKELDGVSFQSALRELASNYLGLSGKSKKMYLAYPICRYADEVLMADLTKEAPKWRSSVSGNDAPPLRTFRNACFYSNTKAAMLLADKFYDLYEYAKVRNTDADTIRDQYLSDVGINEHGEKVYDLGNQIVTAVLQPDLTFLIRKADGKTAKSLPKKDADPNKYASANADFSEMKKNAKKIVKNRCNILWNEFLSGRTRPAEDWKKSYTLNPLLRSVARLLVWQQGDDTFTLTDSKAIHADGSAYEIHSEPIRLAHPMEINPDKRLLWQKYFVNYGIKQPFSQIWEPIIDPASIKEDRYKGCMIPYYRFRSMEKHGIHVEDEDFHNEINIRFDDCNAEVQQIDRHYHEINNDDRFEVISFSFKRYTRQVNHIAAYLDRITIYDRILKDDVTIETFLPGFTLAQIADFIKLATEKGCPNVTSLLLNYKNEHFADFDPMEEFTLGEL